MSNKSFNFCNNCGKNGHVFHTCKHPITSIGIICFRINENNIIEYLMIKRKHSLGFVEFMRGKYPLYNYNYLINIFNEMSNKEKEIIKGSDFDDLWKYLWGDQVGIQYRGEEKISRDKYELLKLGINNKEEYNLEKILNECKYEWDDTEWGFPKGRRNYQEKDLSCALREFEEETGYDKNSLKLIQNIIPLEEIFTGSNYKSYKHKYYIAKLDKNVEPIANYQKSEVSKVDWLSLNECQNLIRPYNLERLDLLKKVDNILKTYLIC